MRRISLRFIPLLALCLSTACLQVIDPNAASGGGGAGQGDGSDIQLDTPPIELPGGGTTDDACESTTLQAMDILEANCASCHGGGSPGARQGQPPFDYVLDVAMLETARSESVPDPTDPSLGMRFLIPGDPDDSRVYTRIANFEMPPEVPVGLPEIPRPSISDISVLNSWISDCMQ